MHEKLTTIVFFFLTVNHRINDQFMCLCLCLSTTLKMPSIMFTKAIKELLEKRNKLETIWNSINHSPQLQWLIFTFNSKHWIRWTQIVVLALVVTYDAIR